MVGKKEGARWICKEWLKDLHIGEWGYCNKEFATPQLLRSHFSRRKIDSEVTAEFIEVNSQGDADEEFSPGRSEGSDISLGKPK